jgi:hypothetical protein
MRARPSPSASVRVDADGLLLNLGGVSLYRPWSGLLYVTLHVAYQAESAMVTIKATLPGGAVQSMPEDFRIPGFGGDSAVVVLSFPSAQAAGPQLAGLHAALQRHALGVYVPDQALVAQLSR